MNEELRHHMLMQGYLQTLLNDAHEAAGCLGDGYLEKADNLAEFSLVASTAILTAIEQNPDLNYPGVFWYEVPELLFDELIKLLEDRQQTGDRSFTTPEAWDALLEAWTETVFNVFWTWIAAEDR